MTPSDRIQLRLLRSLRRSESRGRVERFQELNRHLSNSMPAEWNVCSIVQNVLNRIGLDFDDIAYLNLVKWRTRGERLRMGLLRRSWRAHTHQQIELLKPSAIVISRHSNLQRSQQGAREATTRCCGLASATGSDSAGYQRRLQSTASETSDSASRPILEESAMTRSEPFPVRLEGASTHMSIQANISATNLKRALNHVFRSAGSFTARQSKMISARFWPGTGVKFFAASG